MPFSKALLNFYFDLSTFYNHFHLFFLTLSNGHILTQPSKYQRLQDIFLSFVLCFSCNINTTKKNEKKVEKKLRMAENGCRQHYKRIQKRSSAKIIEIKKEKLRKEVINQNADRSNLLLLT
jgi:hypothetical protein